MAGSKAGKKFITNRMKFDIIHVKIKANKKQ